ncbi:hypothetical protein EVAR_3992_1 [Eumeta japonica]|uniref:Uncharacterized protein n=1 Tax=Eumeta variegata TaxID=151549 RepID=A0A4C1T6M8_EUMVA|nr:hypothetical protein EVAR_3992_1 [Eumeta japonica]
MNLHFREHIKRVRKTAIYYQARLNGMLVLHRDLELPTISKYMKDASERFFSNPLLSAAVFYEAPPLYYLIYARPWNALTDLPDALTAEDIRLIEINKQT